ncbi:MAG: integrin alpha [Acidobacteria bacterium]|nr:integrin alpha [Acidobacteriota bacterium]
MTRDRFLFLCALLMLPSVAGASEHAPTNLDLRQSAKVRITGAWNVASGGDLNADGSQDVLVSRDSGRGKVWAVFGKASLQSFHVKDFNEKGFLILGPSEDALAAQAAGAGDVNGDGLDDVLVGAPRASNGRGARSGVAYVVFGKASTTEVRLEQFHEQADSTSGFRIDGANERDFAGQDVSGIGDINHDGLDDILVSAPFAGRSYVVFGKESTEPVDLLAFEANVQGTQGFRIDTPTPEFNTDYSVSAAGDVNDDGTSDVLLGVVASPGARGSAYVVFGKSDPVPVDVNRSMGQSFRVQGTYGGSATGYAVSEAGDMNADGFDDVLIGAPSFYCCGHGAVYLVYGQATTEVVHLNRLEEKGYKIKAEGTSDKEADILGASVDSLSDVNGDGIHDALLGAPGASFKDRDRPGVSYLVFGKPSSSSIRLKSIKGKGIRLIGPRSRLFLGDSVAALGDLNGDGVPEIAMGNGLTKVFVVWGQLP